MPALYTGADALRVRRAINIEAEWLRAVGTIPGVVVTYVAGANGPGEGYLRCNRDGDAVAWRAPGSSTYGPYVPRPADGTYYIEDGDDPDAYLRVAAYADYLEADIEAQVLVSDRFNNRMGYEDVAAEDAAAGEIVTYNFGLRNVSSSRVHRPSIWLDPATDDLQISDDQVTWVSPTTEATALVLPDMDPNDLDVLYVKRTIGAAAESSPSVLNLLQLSFVSCL